ncbi:MAG: imidazole glycerol phosphate synthase subunit HisH [Chloroflexi bacterium]|nr:imidazole glycerol phosphate synthase subunit HisH [Chloroflexota bacterium]
MSDNKQTAIIDYGLGNLFSIQRVVSHLGGIPLVTSDPSEINAAARLILPGVGAFGDGMEKLKSLGLVGPVKDYVRSGRPLLGICLGMQLLMSLSEEFGLHEGLDLVPGRVKRLPDPGANGPAYKIPHIGWSHLEPPHQSSWKGTIFEGIETGVFVYFVHSYVVAPDSPQPVLAETEYGGIKFCAALRQGNLFGCQFHPEVSGEVGLHILRNYLNNF